MSDSTELQQIRLQLETLARLLQAVASELKRIADAAERKLQ